MLITARVQRQVADLFVAEDKGSQEFKGVPAPVVATLLRRWERARAGDGQVVQIVGEPGLGKSLLVEEFHARLGEMPHTWLELSSSELLQNTPLHPVTEWGRARFGGPDVSAEARLADLESTLAQVKARGPGNLGAAGPAIRHPVA